MLRSSSGARCIDTEALKRERPLVDVVASYGVTLRRESAGTYRALCPFHQEHTPSFWIDARDASSTHYYCFGCLAHGDTITFVMEREGCSFQEACERLSARGRLPTVEPAQRTPGLGLGLGKPPGRRWEQLLADSVEARVLDVAVQAYEQAFWQDARAQAYVHRRAVSEEVARVQRLGYANGHALLDRLKGAKDGADMLPVAVQLGLVLERPDAEDVGHTQREFFLDRLIIPELRQGRPIWCIGRAIEDEVRPPVPDEVGPPVPILRDGAPLASAGAAAATTSAGLVRRPRPKYLGLPGEKPVMGLEQVTGRHAAFIVEGPFDMLAAIGWGLPALAICGSHFPLERLPALAEALAIYGVFDPDRAGRSAAERFAPLFGSRWRPVWLPNSLDLAELATLGAAGREMFDILVGRARAAAWQGAQAL
ncbi:MAG: CHC2 zinc finger domain-containing protein [Chloroflexota bacterium]|nr:CHC2 zinc finger domain-containing protein [Chloroflexota bacterium]